MQQAYSLVSLSAASHHVPADFTKVPGWRAYATREGDVWEYAPKTGVWRRCPNSPKKHDGRRQVSMTSDDGTQRPSRIRSHVIYATFHGPVPAGIDVDHEDQDPTNDRASNLQLLPRLDHNAKTRAAHGKFVRQRVRAAHRDGRVLFFDSKGACERYLGAGKSKTMGVTEAIRRGTYASMSHSPFKDWIITLA